MRVISKKALIDFWGKHADAKGRLTVWYRLIEANGFKSLPALKRVFRSADLVGELVIFNIGGNRYRLICQIDFKSQRVYVLQVLTHAEYDRGKWKRQK